MTFTKLYSTILAAGGAAVVGAGAASAQSADYVVIDSSDLQGRTDYRITYTGRAEKVEGTLAGVNVSVGDDQVGGGVISGYASSGADGYRIHGDITTVELSNPAAADIHIGPTEAGGDRTESAIAAAAEMLPGVTGTGGESGSGDPGSGGGGSAAAGASNTCMVSVSPTRVEFLDGQGIGEGALELDITHRSGQETALSRDIRLPTGSSQPLSGRLITREIQAGRTQAVSVTTQVDEREVGADRFAGQDDYGENTKRLTLRCGVSQTVGSTVTIDSDRGNDGRVRITYQVQDDSL